MKYTPDCYNMSCNDSACIVVHLPTFGDTYFCAGHGLMIMKMAPDGILA